MRLAALSLALMAGSMAHAEEPAFPFDPDRLFADHAAQIVQSADGSERLDMPGGITVVRKDGKIIAASDSSGAVGCALMIHYSLYRIAEVCAPLAPAEKTRAKAQVDRLIAFSAANAYPPITPAELEAILAKSTMAKVDQGSCEQAKAEGWLESSLASLGNVAQERQLDALLAVPRLPVMNPCL